MISSKMFKQQSKEIIEDDICYDILFTENVLNILDDINSNPIMGEDAEDSLLNMTYKGLTPGTLTLFSANSNGGKTTFLVQNAINLVKNHNKKVLFISLEQSKEDILRLCLSCLTGINRSYVGFTDVMSEEETKKVYNVVLSNVLKNLIIIHLEEFNSDFDKKLSSILELLPIDTLIFDYISSELTYTDNVQRDDLNLKSMTTKLKNLAIKYNISVLSGTQLNNSERDKKATMRNASWIRGSYAIPDKADVAMIASGDFFKCEEEVAKSLGANLVIDIYKNRKGRNNIKVFRKINFATFEYTDLMVTDEEAKKNLTQEITDEIKRLKN